MELFFKDVIKLIKKDSEIIDLIKENAPTDFTNLFHIGKKDNKIVLKKSLKFSDINSFFSNDDNKDIINNIWRKMKMPPHFSYPKDLPNELLYGNVT